MKDKDRIKTERKNQHLTGVGLPNRVRPRFFYQVGHETMYASRGNKHFFTKSYRCQTYKNYEQS